MITALGMPRTSKMAELYRKLQAARWLELRRYEGDHLCVWESITSDCGDVVEVLIGDDLPDDEALMLHRVMTRVHVMDAIEVERVHCMRPNDLLFGSTSFTFLRFYREGADHNCA